MSHDGTKLELNVFKGLATRVREILTVGDDFAGQSARSGAADGQADTASMASWTRKNLRYNIHCIFPVVAIPCLICNEIFPKKAKIIAKIYCTSKLRSLAKPDWLHKGVIFHFEKGLDSLISRRSVFLFLAICLACFALVLTPERLASFGIMDSSLESDNPLTQQSALRLVLFARLGLAACAMALAALGVAAPRIEASAFFERRIREGSSFPKNYEQEQLKFFKGTMLVAFSGLIIASLYLVLGSRVGDEALGQITQEDRLVEWLSAVFLLAASLTALRVGTSMPNKAHAAMHIFFAVLFFVMLGEEISWGQRILGFSTPDSLVQINVQGETNIHNSFGYLFDHLFILGFFVWGCVLPLLYWYEPIWRWYQSRLGIPVPSLGLSFAMLGVTLFQEQITDSLFGVVPGLRVPELRELMSALCFLLMMIESRELTAGKQKAAESLARVSG